MMHTTRTSNRSGRVAKVLGVAAVAMLFAAGCGGFRSESDGAKAGRAICDLKGADNQNEAERAMRKLDRNLDQAKRTTGIPVSEDLREIDDQLSDLQNHAASGNSALAQQDLAKLRRNVDQAVQTTSGNTQRFYQGLQQGLSNCDDS